MPPPSAPTPPRAAEAWAAANRSYEERFDRGFPILPAGRTAGAMLESLPVPLPVSC